MKRKFFLTSALFILVAMKSFAQNGAAFPIFADDISEIVISDKIDVVLTQAEPENIAVRIPDNVMGKLDVTVDRGRLFLGAGKKAKDGERLTVYVWVSNLEKLTLNGNAFATSVGVLHNKNLLISAGKEAKVSIKSDGKVWFDAPGNYQVAEGKGYSYIQML
jgi:hypothetical protein